MNEAMYSGTTHVPRRDWDTNPDAIRDILIRNLQAAARREGLRPLPGWECEPVPEVAPVGSLILIHVFGPVEDNNE